MKIEGVKEVLDLLKKKEIDAKLSSEASVVVGYANKYALFVHENMEQKWVGISRPSGLGVYWGPAGAGPKFLEAPARQMRSVLTGIVERSMKSGLPLLQCLYLAGLKLQAESQKRVPVEHGFLRASAFTQKE